MVFSPKTGNYLSLKDKKNGREYIQQRDNESYLYRLSIVDQKGINKVWTNLSAQKILCQIKEGNSGPKAILSFKSHQAMDVNVRIVVELDRRGLLLMEGSVENNENVLIRSLELPGVSIPLQLGESAQDDYLVLPFFDGMVINNLKRIGLKASVAADYPGSASVQFLSFLDQAGGIYLASEDSDGHPKAHGYRLEDGRLRLYIENRFPEEKGKSISMSYRTVLGFVHNSQKGVATTWYDAADLYKAWAVKQPWAEKQNFQRGDIPDWFKNGVVILDYPIRNETGKTIEGHIPSLINESVDFADIPVVIRPRGWEKQGTWIGPDIFPPFEEERFKGAINKMKGFGRRIFLYIEGYQWMLSDPNYNYDGQNYFREHCVDCAVVEKNADTSFNHHGRIYSEGCRTTNQSQEMLYKNAIKCVELGSDALQIEVVGGGGRPCYNPRHSHPPGYGLWIFERFAELLQRVRRDGRKLNSELVLTIEEPCELYIPFLDGYNGRDFVELKWPRHIPLSRGIPLFTYIYHEYALGFSGYHWNFLTKGKMLYLYRNVAMNFISGKMNGFNFLKNPNDPIERFISVEARQFMRDTVQMAYTVGQKYLLLGKMLRPARIEAEKVNFFYPVVRKTGKRKEEDNNWTEAQVLHSVWQAPTGELGYVFANYTPKLAAFTVELSHYDILKNPLRMRIHRSGKKETAPQQEIVLPVRKTFQLAPLEVMLIEFEPKGSLSMAAINLRIR